MIQHVDLLLIHTVDGKYLATKNYTNSGVSVILLKSLMRSCDLFEEDELSAEDELFDGRLPLAGTDDLKDGTEREEVDGIDL